MATKHLLWLACALAASGCAGPQPSPPPSSSPPSSSVDILAARTELDTALHTCTNTYRYNPRQASNISEHALAPQELAWNRCAYAAVATYEKANPKLAPMYEQLVTSYQQMTGQVLAGALTRSQRQARTRQMLQAIEQAEQAEIAAANLQQAERSRQQQNVIDTIRMFGAQGFQR